jgi:hypothetical protein
VLDVHLAQALRRPARPVPPHLAVIRQQPPPHHSIRSAGDQRPRRQGQRVRGPTLVRGEREDAVGKKSKWESRLFVWESRLFVKKQTTQQFCVETC